MTTSRCPYCHEFFAPSRYRPDQAICSAPDCQRRRKTEYHRRKIQTDPNYRAQCRDSQQQWREQHPDYMRAYRQSAMRRTATQSSVSAADLHELLDRVKNNLVLDLKTCHAKIFVITTDVQLKNTLALAQLIVIEHLPSDPPITHRVKNIRLGNGCDSSYKREWPSRKRLLVALIRRCAGASGSWLCFLSS